ncbi:sporulation protein YqfC [Phosphitispora fastidiosa]|uniref:sporulation protein YqfC n=1 Tax=Phosphitispora fastidiosa TaxID=2837202 RepID=UPI001E2F868B|nr:sporulation protein YqfC [Phosphitispora fastidiosa]MBU7005890.1 sporulation protein YqfC [Phosphitispora fastidiosa]
MSWRDRKKQIQQQVANVFDIPRDLMMDLPKVVLVGDVQVLIENHRGIMVYTPETVKVSTTIGDLAVTGTDLTLKNILPDEIMVEGRIKSVIFTD